MKRENGFLCIDNCKRKQANEHFKKTDHYWVYINGEEYYFKPTEHHYNELIGYHAAQILGVDACFCDLAILDGEKGIISKSLRKEDTKLTSGYEILEDYAYSSISNLYWIKKMIGRSYVRYEFDRNYRKEDASIPERILHDLENIWHALEYKYKDDKRYDSEKIMNQIVKMFIFMLLSYDEDRFSFDWLIEESKNDIRLAPLLDNEFSFNYDEYKHKQRQYISMSPNSKTSDYSQLELIKEFLNISSSEYYDLFVTMYNTLYNSFCKVIQNVESQIGTKIPEAKRNEIYDGFIKNMDAIYENVLKHKSNKK